MRVMEDTARSFIDSHQFLETDCIKNLKYCSLFTYEKINSFLKCTRYIFHQKGLLLICTTVS